MVEFTCQEVIFPPISLEKALFQGGKTPWQGPFYG